MLRFVTFRNDRGALTAMITQGEDLEAHVLHERGWTISAIARHLGRDRKTVRAYLSGERKPGERKPAGPDAFAPYATYCEIRLNDDPHLWGTTLLDELQKMGYAGSYQAFTRALRVRGLRPRCERCAAAGVPDEFAVIDHDPGAETQWDWLELPNPPASWECGKMAHLLVGSLPYSGKWRGVLAEAEDQAHLIAALHQCCERLGGVSREWRFDRMATVCQPGTGQVSASFAAVAKYYSVLVNICPSQSGWRKGSVEKSNDSAAQRWWRTLADEVSPPRAQVLLDQLSQDKFDARPRRRPDGEKVTVGVLAGEERLRPLPGTPYPAVIEDSRQISPQALVSWKGNLYSVPPGRPREQAIVRHQLGAGTVDIVTPAGVTLARHYREPDHAGAVTRADRHVAALEASVREARALRGAGPCHRKARRPLVAGRAGRGRADHRQPRRRRHGHRLRRLRGSRPAAAPRAGRSRRPARSVLNPKTIPRGRTPMSSTDMTTTTMSADTSTEAAGASDAAAPGDSNRADSHRDAIRNGSGPVPGPDQCKRPGCGAPLPAPGPGRARAYCSDVCRHRYNNSLRGAAVLAGTAAGGPGALAALGRLGELIGETGGLLAVVQRQVADAAPERVAAAAAAAEAARRAAEARAAAAEARAAQAEESAAAAWEAADAAGQDTSDARADAESARAQARDLAGQLPAALARAEQAGTALAEARAGHQAAVAAAARAEAGLAAARELAAAATARAERAETEVEAGRARAEQADTALAEARAGHQAAVAAAARAEAGLAAARELAAAATARAERAETDLQAEQAERRALTSRLVAPPPPEPPAPRAARTRKETN